MELAISITAALLFLAGVSLCLVNAYMILHNLLRSTAVSMLPLWGSIFMVAGLMLREPSLPCVSLLPFLMFDLSGLPSLLLLPFYLLARALRGADAAPLLPNALKAGLIVVYMLWVGFYVLVGGLVLLSGTELLPTPS